MVSSGTYRRLPANASAGRYEALPFDIFSLTGNFEWIMNESRTNFEFYRCR